MKLSLRTLSVAAGFLALAGSALAGTISGAGATFPYPIYAKWAGAYQGVSGGCATNYRIDRFRRRHRADQGEDRYLRRVRHAAETGRSQRCRIDPVSDRHRRGSHGLQCAWHRFGPACPRRPHHCRHLPPQNRQQWNDPAIKKLELRAQLCRMLRSLSFSARTVRERRSCLRRVSRASATIGSRALARRPRWIGRRASARKVTKALPATSRRPAARSVMSSMPHAKQNRYGSIRVWSTRTERRSARRSTRSARPPASNADWNAASKDNFYIILVDQPGEQSWPITATTYILMYKNPVDPATSASALKFFKWAYANGDNMALSLDYVPLPQNAVDAIQASWKQIQGSGM